MKSRIAVCAAALGATLLVSHDAFAGGKGGKANASTIELARPAGGPDADAAGTVRVEHGRKGDRTVLELSNLDPRTVYEVRDASTGETLGDVKTNRRGRATFNLTKRLAKTASAGGADASGVEDVEIVDPATGDSVLEGGVVADPSADLQFGWGDYANDAGDSASVFLQSAPGFGSESFSLTFFPVQESFAAAFYDFTRDTALGDTLPLGVDSVTELAGREFQIVSPDGTVVIDDVLPDLEAAPIFSIDDPATGDWPVDWTGDFDWTGGFDGMGGFDFPAEFDWTGDPSAFDPDGNANPARHGHMKKARRGGVKEDPATDPVLGYTLRIEDENGDLVDAGALEQVLYDQPVDCPWTLPDGGDLGGIFIGIIVVPLDGSFDLEAFLDGLFGGGTFDPDPAFDLGGFDLSGLFGGATKHAGR